MTKARAALVLAVGALLALPLTGAAGDAETERIAAMEQRLRALEDRLEASTATIEAQRDLLQRHAPAVSDGSEPDGFFSGLEVGGFITGSYLYNFNSPAGNAGAQPLCQFNCTHDEFSFDAAMIEIGKSASKPGEWGFQLDVLYGKNAVISRGLSPTGALTSGTDSDAEFFIQEAYVTYNWNDVELKFGNWETLLGWELLDSHLNYNITHGVLFTWAIPLYHTGILASGSLSESVGWSIGLTNGFNNITDQNDNKGIVGIFTYESGPLFSSLSYFYGAEAANLPAGAQVGSPGTSDKLMIFDFVTSFELSDTTALWLNIDYGEQEDGTMRPVGGTFTDSDYWGVAVGANFTLSDKLSFALRGEWWEDEDDVRGAGGGLGFDSDVEIRSLTGTLKYQMSDNAYVRGELRWDTQDDDTAADGNRFPDDSSTGTDDSSLLGIVELSYVFD